MPPTTSPYGSWASPITTDLIVAESVGLGQIALDGGDVYWAELRPLEAGRQVVVKRTPDGAALDVTPAPFNVRTRVHEYGGGAYAVSGGTVYFTNFADQRVYRQPVGQEPCPITPEGDIRHADFEVDLARSRLVCVQENHSNDGEPVNSVVGVPMDTCDGVIANPEVLVSGSDFYSSPRLSPDGSWLCWLSWNHPNMPWDGTELWVGELEDDGKIGQRKLVAGGSAESICQPEWAPDGRLYFVSDRTGWLNLYRWDNRTGRGAGECVLAMEAEFARPQWVFGANAYGFVSADRAICAVNRGGVWELLDVDLESGRWTRLDIGGYSAMGRSDLRVVGDSVFFEAGGPTEPNALLRLDLVSGRLHVVRRSNPAPVDPDYLSAPETIEFPTESGLTAHAFFYPPRNRDFTAPEGAKPPLLLKSHGGPTAATSNALDLEIQFWTSRGFAVVDVNYGGSTGYGREYRRRLERNWGVVDVDDCVNAARHLAAQGLVDEKQLAIDGGSAGGYTTLAALTFRDIFSAGASYYGVSDLETLARDTHKFESRYLDTLVGPYPEEAAVYRERSPINFTERLSRPIILLQGLEDRIVPPDQAEAMFDAVRAKGIPTAYLAFAGEQHGFRQAGNIKRALEAELYFFCRLFGIEPADAIEPVDIENL